MKKIAIIFRDSKSKKWEKIYKKVESIFIDSSIKCFWKNKLTYENLKDKDLIITIGGDGTFLSASHFIKNQKILGVNQNPKKSEGALTSINKKNLKKKLKEIFKGRLKVKNYSRINVKIIQKNKCVLTKESLNEVYIGNIYPYHTSKYNLKFGKKHENQMSSGILVSTGTGSNAWYKSMGGKPFSKTKKEIRFKIREPYVGKIHKAKLKNGKIKKGRTLEIKNLISHQILVIDSIRKYKLKKNDKVIISLGNFLKVIK